MAANLYLRQKCDGLKESDKTKVLGILGDITNKVEIDKKYDIVLESILGEQEEDKDEKFEYVCPECGEEVTKDKEGEYECPKCGTAMKIKKADDKGKGNADADDADDKDDKKDEGVDPFADSIKRWKQILNENKI